MASGCVPLIHDWYGADYLYPARFLFGDPDSCLQLLRDCEKADLRSLQQENRAFIAERYQQDLMTAKIRRLLADVAGRRPGLTEGSI
jgi:hypothetical protein